MYAILHHYKKKTIEIHLRTHNRTMPIKLYAKMKEHHHRQFSHSCL